MEGTHVLALAMIAASLVSGLIVWRSSRAFDARYGKPEERDGRG